MPKINVADVTRWDIFTRQNINPNIYDWVANVLRDLDPIGSCVAVSACNGAGKSSEVIGNAVVCHLLQYPRGRVVCTSANERQLTYVIMGYLQRHAEKFPTGTQFKTMGITVPLLDKATGKVIGKSEYISFTTNDPGMAEGWHGNFDEPLLLIVDEGKTVDDMIFSAFDRCTAQRRLVVSSPPLEASGEFYNIFFGLGSWPWKLHKVTWWMCPHLEKLYPGKYELMKRRYGEDHPIFRSMMLGEFSQDTSTSVMDVKYVDSAMYEPPMWNEDKRQFFFIDWSGGTDELVVARLEGNRVTFPLILNEADTNKAVDRVYDKLREFNAQEGEVGADDGGLGRPMNYSLEKKLGFKVNRFNGGLPAHQKIYYANRINELWFTFNDLLKKRTLILPKDDTLRHQLISRRKADVGKNESRLAMETKREMKLRGLNSPDRADAVIGVVMLAGAIKTPKDRIEKPKEEKKKNPIDKFFAAIRENDDNYKKKLDNSLESDIRDEQALVYPAIGRY